MALFITFILGIFFLAGIIIIIITDKYKKAEQISIAMAFGAIISLIIFELIPEVFSEFMESGISGKILPFVFIALGVGLLKLIDLLIPEHGEENPETGEGYVHVGIMAAIAISLHNILEGMTVYNLTKIDISTGFTLAFGIGLHNIPMGMLIFAMLKKQNKIKKTVIILITVFSTFIGGLLMSFLRPLLTENILNALVAITLGMVIFILVFELIPSLIQYSKKHISFIAALVGFVLVTLSTLLE